MYMYMFTTTEYALRVVSYRGPRVQSTPALRKSGFSHLRSVLKTQVCVLLKWSSAVPVGLCG